MEHHPLPRWKDFESIPVENVAITIASIAIIKFCMQMKYKYQVSRHKLIIITYIVSYQLMIRLNQVLDQVGICIDTCTMT